MQNVDFPSLSLSTSFRFNESLAKLAVEILGTKRHLIPSFQVPPIVGNGDFSDVHTQAVLGRINAGLLSCAIDLVGSSTASTKIHFVGGFGCYSFWRFLLVV